MEETRERFTVIPNKMSQEVYAHLIEKKQKRKLTEYLISLVERDLKGQGAVFDLSSIEKQLGALMDIPQQLDAISKKIDLIDKVQVGAGESDHSTEIEKFIDDSIALDSRVRGKLKEEDKSVYEY